jgi:hypothetical protein
VVWVIVIAVAVAVVLAVVVAMSRRGSSGSGGGAGSVTVEADRSGPVVADFHVADGAARVHFDVPLPAGDVDTVLADLLIREAVEVVREKRHTLPLGDVHRVVALGRRNGEWEQVGAVELDTPGTLPPPMVPTLLPHAHAAGFDAFEKISDLPGHAPGLADRSKGEELAALTPQVKLPAAVDAGLRAQGLDPSAADATDLALGVMRLAGYAVSERSAGTYDATRAGQRVFVRTVAHGAGDHPELDESAVDRFVVDFMSSGADRGLLITEKFSPFEIYDRERREPRMRFITRERFQAYIDALAVG